LTSFPYNKRKLYRREAIMLIILVAIFLAVELRDLETREFPYPGQARRNQVLFLDRDSIFLFGGNLSPDPRDFQPTAFADDAFAISLETLSSQPKAKLPIPLMSATAVRVDIGGSLDRLWLAMGGQSHNGKEFQVSDTILKYSVLEDRWETSPTPLPAGNTLFGAATHRQSILTFGGWKTAQVRKLVGPPLEVSSDLVNIPIDGSSPPAITKQIPRPRRSFACVTISPHVFLIGGLNDRFGYINECDTFNLETQQFALTPSPKVPRAMAEAAAIDKRIYLCGGFVSNGLLKPFEPITRIEAFDTQTQTWRTIVDELPRWAGGSATRCLVHPKRGLILFEVDPLEPTKARILIFNKSKLDQLWMAAEDTQP
jgi:hypothetical protein